MLERKYLQRRLPMCIYTGWLHSEHFGRFINTIYLFKSCGTSLGSADRLPFLSSKKKKKKNKIVLSVKFWARCYLAFVIIQHSALFTKNLDFSKYDFDLTEGVDMHFIFS